ncbi:hypothetical protein ACFXK0_24385 [Nocardia sp. NPDC059177]|uniref:DUF7373 family lipoprotein n=1 Tax=Nocardia sp. NPDC059177 TaxID=3346759 RepID=UPI0036C4F9CF
MLTTTALLTGCAGRSSILGSPTPARPDLSALDTGDWGTIPLTAPPIDNDNHGRLLEAARIAEVMVYPHEIDPTLRDGNDATPVHSLGRVEALVPEISSRVIQPYGLVTGFTTIRQDRDSRTQDGGTPRTLRITVLSFFGDAEAAAADLADRIRTVSGTSTVEIPEHPEAFGQWTPDIPLLTVFTARGPFVIALSATHPTPDPVAALPLVHAALNKQVARLDQFEATAPEALSSLPADPDAMLSRTLPQMPYSWTHPTVDAPFQPARRSGWLPSERSGSGIVYGARGSEHTLGPFVDEDEADEPRREPSDRAVFLANRMLLRFPTSRGARAQYDHANAAPDGGDAQVETDIPQLGAVADITCFENSVAPRYAQFYCYILDRQYWAAVFASDKRAVGQAAAAQYALLVNSR